MLSKPNETFDVGDIVVWGSLIYLVTDIDEDEEIYTKGKIQLCNNTLKFYSSSILYSIPCIIGKANISQDENKYITLPADENIVTCANTTSSLKITENTRFILSGDAYSIVGIDKISNVGLLSIRIKDDQVTEDDNISLNIADYYSNQHVFTISITNGSTASFSIGQDIQINVNVYMDGVLMDSPVVSFVNANDEVATISSSGLLTTIGSGTTIVTVSAYGVSDSMSITITDEVPEDVYTVDVSGTSSVKLGNNITLTGTVFNNGIEDSTKSITWSFSNQDSSSNIYCTLVSSTSTSITLKATSNSSYVGRYVVVRGSKSDDSLVYDEHIIQIKSLF